MRFMLDTNIVSDLVRQPHGRISARIAEVGETRVCTSIIVAAELRSAAARKASPQLVEQLESVLRAFKVVPLEPPADVVYGALRARLEEIGHPIGANDLFVAIKALPIENWLR